MNMAKPYFTFERWKRKSATLGRGFSVHLS